MGSLDKAGFETNRHNSQVHIDHHSSTEMYYCISMLC